MRTRGIIEAEYREVLRQRSQRFELMLAYCDVLRHTRESLGDVAPLKKMFLEYLHGGADAVASDVKYLDEKLVAMLLESPFLKDITINESFDHYAVIRAVLEQDVECWEVAIKEWTP